MIDRTEIAGTVYCPAISANVAALLRDGEFACSCCGVRNHLVTLHADGRDRMSNRYQTNLDTLTKLQSLWKFGVHGDDGYGWVDVEFKDLVSAASFLQVLRSEIAAAALLRDEASLFRGRPVVVAFPIPDDRDLLGTP